MKSETNSEKKEDDDAPKLEVIRDVIKKLKQNKSLGIDGITAEMIKHWCKEYTILA